MNLTTENILLVGSILLFISLFAGKTSYKVGIPVLILFLGIGMLAGSEGIGGIYFDNPKIAQFIGIIALNFILFSGGFDTDWKAVRPILWQGISLSTLGVLITATSVGIFVWAVTDFTIYEGLLLGSIVSSTDSAAVFSILRSRSIALKGNLRPTLELESGSNDPMAYVLTLLKQIAIGAAMGYIIARLSKIVINGIKLDIEGLYIVLGIAIMFFSFSATDFIGGNGFLAVYICAVYLGNQDLIHKKKFIKSFDSFAWLMQIVLFLTLGLLVFPSQVIPVIGIGLVISIFLILIARPIGVFSSLIMFRGQTREKLFISWVGLRGAVPIVFATYPLLAGVGKANMIFNIVFFISLTSVLIQGSTLSNVAKWMGLTMPESDKPRTQTDIELQNSIKKILTEIIISPECESAGKQIVNLGLPKTILISIIQRDNRFIIPTGVTTLETGDKLFVLTENKEDQDSVNEFFSKQKKAGFQA
jgi:cell volume regulation protein A